MRALNEFVEALDGAKDIETLNRVFQRAIEAVGMKTFGYAWLWPGRLDRVTSSQFHDKCVMGTTYPGGWRERYREQGYFSIDPIIAACRTSLMPIVWDSLRGRETPRGDPVVLGEAADFGLTRGFTVPVHSPKGENAIVSLASDESQKAFEARLRADQHQLHLMAIHFHAHVEANFALPEAHAPVKLSPREVECLRWTADGKTAWEISMILGISENTVNFHLKKSMGKLDVHSKTHAVAKAVSLGLTTL